jgi:DNA-binding beta-propeller fold protein YncE
MAIAALPQSGEIVVVSIDGYLVAVNADGTMRYINALNLWPLGGPANAAAIAVDPLTGRIWAADDQRDEIWSIDSSTGEDRIEVSFPLTNPSRPEQQIVFHDPGLAFAPDGSFMVVSDGSTVNGGGRLLIFHNEPFVIPNFGITGASRAPGGITLTWSTAGAVRYIVQRGTGVANPASFTAIATNLTGLSFTDTNPPPAAAFYRVVAVRDPMSILP